MVEILQSVNSWTQSLREIAYYAWLLLTYIVISTLLGRLTLNPAGMHCPSWTMLLFLVCFAFNLRLRVPRLHAKYSIQIRNAV